jgi:large subunit ribosomal protein L2
MAVKKYKPTSPGRRFMAVSSFDEVTKKAPEKSLVEPLKKTGYGQYLIRQAAMPR